jgi:(1->4)-alpha-D-glucan 1-alpha-D-glucosylmutase
VAYLAELGVSHLYSSPYLQPAAGSTHGYDVVDHSRVNVEIGGAEGMGRMRAALAARGLGEVLDIVPNHMAVGGPASAWWWDVLRHGPASQYAAYFDIDWERRESWLRGAILLPVLGDHYWRTLQQGEIRLAPADGGIVVQYFDQTFPLSPESERDLLESHNEGHAVGEINGSLDALHQLLNHQHYRLGFWRSAEQRLNVRRFMNVSSLVGLRMEEPEVFTATHALPLKWVRDGQLDGLRIDHPDGLFDPAQYLDRLATAAPNTWVVVEKINRLRLPQSGRWAVR